MLSTTWCWATLLYPCATHLHPLAPSPRVGGSYFKFSDLSTPFFSPSPFQCLSIKEIIGVCTDCWNRANVLKISLFLVDACYHLQPHILHNVRLQFGAWKLREILLDKGFMLVLWHCKASLEFPRWMERSPTLAEVCANHRQSSPNAICLCSWVRTTPHGNIDLSWAFRVVGVCDGLQRRAIVTEQCGTIHNTHGTCVNCAIVCHSVPHHNIMCPRCRTHVAYYVRHTTYGTLRMAHMAQRGRCHRHSYPQDPTTMLICHLDAYFYPNKCQYRAFVIEGINKRD